MRTPFSSLQSSAQIDSPRGSSSNRSWTGEVVYAHRDAQNNLLFLFDVIPICGWPPAVESVGLAAAGGRSTPLRGIARVRLRQPFVGNLRNLDAGPSGIIVVPEEGSVVSVEMDEAGWIITGFHSGPLVANDQSIGAANEYSYNPGFEEALSTLNSDSRIPWLYGIDEGDIVFARGDARLKIRPEGIFIGSNTQCMDVYKTTGERFERYVEMRRRAVGRLSYHRQLPGVNAAAQLTSAIQLSNADALVINTDIQETSPYYSANQPYLIRQRGHVTRSTVSLGRLAGEVLPLPTEVTTETAAGTFVVERETIVVPKAPPTGTSADSNELTTTSSIVYDRQVGADGSFHVKAGNTARIPGVIQLGRGESAPTAFQFSYDAASQEGILGIVQAGKLIAGIRFNGLSGTLELVGTQNVSIQGNEFDAITENISLNAASGFLKLAATNAYMGEDGVLKLLGDVLAPVLPGPAKTPVVSLVDHYHPYVNGSTPSFTSPPLPTPPGD